MPEPDTKLGCAGGQDHTARSVADYPAGVVWMLVVCAVLLIGELFNG